MHKWFYSTFLFLCLLPPSGSAAGKLQVAVSIPPQQYIVERIAGDLVDVRVMLKPGESPETFDPTPRQIRELYNARVYFRIGVAFEKRWINSLQSNNSGIRIADCCENLIGRQSLSLDNHVWTSARNMRLFARLVKDELSAVEPAHADVFAQHYATLLSELDALDREIAALLQNRRTDYFVISHAELGHFANDYGLTQVALENEGKELGARSLVNIIRLAEEENIRTLFMQKQHASATALAFAREIGAEIIDVDPLHGDYITNLRHITNLIATATR